MDGPEAFTDVIDYLSNMFGGVLSREVIVTVAESCGGDLNMSIDAIMKINDSQTETTISDNSSPQSSHMKDNVAESSGNTSKSRDFLSAIEKISNNSNYNGVISYATASQRTGAMPKQVIKPNRNTSSPKRMWNTDIQRVISFHVQGSRTLILLRGLPGSGKSHLARRIVEMTIGSNQTDYNTHIFSADDYFMYKGQYHYNKYEICDAHKWNQNRAKIAMEQGLSPIIIDNTNIEMWEMAPYAKTGVANGYILEVTEPNTPWARNPTQLARRNIHKVSATNIKRKLDMFTIGITGDSIKVCLGLSYPADKIPPVIRKLPVYQPENQNHAPKRESTDAVSASISNHTTCNANEDTYIKVETINKSLTENNQVQNNILVNEPDIIVPSKPEILIDFAENVTEKPSNLLEDAGSDLNTSPKNDDEKSEKLDLSVDAENITSPKNDDKESGNLDLYVDIEKQFDDIEKLEQEWEKGENWVDESNSSKDNVENPDAESPKPQRLREAQAPLYDCQDWTQIAMFMPPWQENTSSTKESISTPVETSSRETCMELGDFGNSSKMFKEIDTTSRDINQFYVPKPEKIPQVRMLDKSSMTNENFIMNSSSRCQREHSHFRQLRKLFKNVSKTALQEIFEKCIGDVNWTVNIVIDGVASKELETLSDCDISDDDEDPEADNSYCTCLSAYNILPDLTSQPQEPQVESMLDLEHTPVTTATPNNAKKGKKDTNVSESALNIKQHIEKNVNFSESHYSNHCLKIRKKRRGEYEPDAQEMPQSSAGLDNAHDSQYHSNDSEVGYQDIAACLPDNQKSDDENSDIVDDIENTVNINLGKEFILELDYLFGRKDMTYPTEVIPKINIPMSLLNEINALWMESLMYQLDQRDKQTDIMLKEDEEFARQLSLKEAELALTGKEPDVLDFKEIMDMDLALSIYQKDIAEWKNNIPNDLAAKLTRDKLYNLFPDVAKDVLSELLMAHDNNFQSTVEVLLVSTGKSHILKEKNGLNKFVMKKELERQEKILEEERKALMEVEWPLLPKGEVVEMAVVNSYRDEANRHIFRRNVNLQKANDYVRRGMLQVAAYYYELAAFHKLRYEQSNSLAAASLMQVHAANCRDTATIDLHYLRVGEARESLDLFIDTHIQRLKETLGRGPRFHTLFFITGRGLHSNGKPKIKPSVIKRLAERGLVHSERNPGLLTAKVSADDKMSYQVP